MPKKSVPPVIIALICSALVYGLVYYFIQNFLSINQAVRDREIQLLESFELQWVRPVTSLAMKVDDWDLYDDQVLMRLQGNQIILPVQNRNTILTAYAALTSFALGTGEINWQTKIPWLTEVIGQNSNHVFVVTEHLGNKPRGAINACNSASCENVKITAYDAQSGKESWAIFYANMSYVDRLFIDDDIISVNGSGVHGSYNSEFSLDASTGRGLPEFQEPTFHGENADSYEAIITNSGFDSDDIVSNYADNGNFIFFLTEQDSTLWAVEKSTSQIVGQVQFDREPFLTFTDGYIRGFSVAVSDDIIVVYLGDSEQLFTFRFLPSE